MTLRTFSALLLALGVLAGCTGDPDAASEALRDDNLADRERIYDDRRLSPGR